MGQEAAEDQPFTFGASQADPGFTLRLDSYEQGGSEFLHVLTRFRDLMGLRNNGSNGLQGNDTQVSGQGYKTVGFTRWRGNLHRRNLWYEQSTAESGVLGSFR
jgi:hypothetical protein